MIGIYKITNKINGKVYIGSSNNITTRWKQHIDNLMKNKHHCLRLQYDFNENTLNDFNFSILEVCTTERLAELEQKYIDFYLKNSEIYNTNLKINDKRNEKRKITKRSKKTYVPHELVDEFTSVGKTKLILYILNKSKEQQKVIFTIKEFQNTFQIKSNSTYDFLDNIIRDISKNNKSFKYIEYNKSIITAEFIDSIYNSLINKTNCYIIKNDYKNIISEINCQYTFKVLMKIFENKNNYTVKISDFKKYLLIDNKYNDYNNLKKSVINPIISDITKLKYKIKFETARFGRQIDLISFILE